ncbi:uncharacterized protein LOC125772378 isoform X6 [Anopheles funestus]|uniref:uncharacterized protein LOC125772378 isoform X6 n=1 Tax=Anopheles funestus TaxID=62324 RepID=UPI0020C6DC12|nr:uncharacterized protein LOC125772378 isoform X6 [Anopheles funestus]
MESSGKTIFGTRKTYSTTPPVDRDFISPTNEDTPEISSMHVGSYNLRMAMVIVLRAITLRSQGKLFDFKITMEDPNAGKFDDVVIRYSLPSNPEEYANVYIQAKHKQTSHPKLKPPLIAEDSLLTKSNSKSPFSIPMYFVSYLHGYDESLKGSHTYILCTNRSIDKRLKEYFNVRKHATDHMLSFCDDIEGTCYSFNSKHRFIALEAELRIASVEKLGQMIALHVKKEKQIDSNIYIFKIFGNLIAECVEKHDLGTFQFNERFRNADKTTIIGKLRSSFELEYLKQTTTKEVKWKDVRIMIDQTFIESIGAITHQSISEEIEYYEAIDVVIQEFYDKFMLVCGSMNETELSKKIFDIMPTWVSNPKGTYNDLHSMLFESMVKRNIKTWVDIKQQFIETNTNEMFNKVQTFTNQYLSSLYIKYYYVNVKSTCLQETALNDFMRSTSFGDVHRYRCSTNLKLNCLIVSQTLALHQYQCLFVDSSLSHIKENFCDVICELVEFIAAVELSAIYIITILGQQENVILKAIKNYAKTYKTKIIIVEEPMYEDPTEDRLFVRDLTDEAREQLFVHNLKLSGTTIALKGIVRGDDSLCMLLSVLENYHATNMPSNGNSNLNNFEKIKPWYIPRSCVPYSEDKQDVEQYLVEEEITTAMVQPIISLKNIRSHIPIAFNHEDNVKVHIFLDDAGYGKSTYFTWLASALSEDNASLYVIRMNALQYVNVFVELHAFDPKTLEDVDVIRIFYRLLHLTLFESNINFRSTNELNDEKQKGDRIAKLLKVLNRKIILDDKLISVSKLALEELIQLRVFQRKFNENKFICLLDGFDEIAPHYKDFVMKYFAKLSTFDGIRKLFISTRPYNFRDVLKHVFSGCMMWRLEPFSQRDRIQFLNNYLQYEIQSHKFSSEIHRIQILQTVYLLATNSIQELKIIPLFLHMAITIALSRIRDLLSVERLAVFVDLFQEIKFDQLQIVSNFLEEKLSILNNEQSGTKSFAFKTTIQRKRHDEANIQMKRRFSLLAMLNIFNNGVEIKLLSDKEQQEAVEFMREISQGNEKTGIIRDIRDDVPHFIHRIFAEYFAATWIYANKHLLKSESFFRSVEYWNGALYRTRDFLNRMIIRDSERSDIFIAVINQSEQQVREILSKDSSAAFVKDAAGRLPLHVAVMYRSEEIKQSLLDKMEFQSVNTKDDLFLWTALDYTFAKLNKKTISILLAARAVVHKETILQQILSNNLRNMLIFAQNIEIWAQSNDNLKQIALSLLSEVVEYLINKSHTDILRYHMELDFLTILEFCSKRNMITVFTLFLSRMYSPGRISFQEINQLLQLSVEYGAYDIFKYLTDHINMLFTKLETEEVLISAAKSSIKENLWYLFKHILQQLCFQSKIDMIDEIAIITDDYHPDDSNIPTLVKKHFPKSCCVRSSENVRISLPEYDEKDVLYEGYLVEALLAEAVHEGNLPMVKYIVQKTKTAITNRLIVMVMRLLPKGEEVCHEKSMSAFTYLLERTTDLDSVDEDGRNLLHMTAQNGCFFMLPCLIDKGFDPSGENTKNGWNVFHYVAFDQDEDRTGKILEFLMMKCDMNWFDDLDSLVDSPIQALDAITNYNTQKVKQLNKQEHAWLAMFVILSKQEYTKLLSGQEVQEAIEIMQAITQGNVRTVIIRDVRDDVPQFTHRIFAEYFAASWIYNNKHLMRSESFFRSWEYWNGELCQTRDFLNRMIVRDCERSDIFMAVINQSEHKVREFLAKDPSVAFVKDAAGRYPLHIAVLYESLEIKKMLVEKMSLDSINNKDELFQWTALDYAFAIGCKISVKHLLTAKATVDEYVLFQQIISNSLRVLLCLAQEYRINLNFNQHFNMIANRLSICLIQYLLNERNLDVFSRQEELDYMTVLEFCSKRNMIGLFEQFVYQLNIQKKLSSDPSNNLFHIASINKSHDIVAYFVDIHNRLLPQLKSVFELISALKSCIKHNHMNLFKDLFQRLLNFQINIHLDDDTDIVIDDHATGNCNLSPLDKGHYPKSCCVRSFENVRISLPEYDEKDILHEGYLVEALLAEAVHEGNLQIVKYIVQKTKTAITNRLIVMVMRLLPKGEEVCHEKSMSAFTYLLERTTDLDSVDEDGRNLLHMTAQNGCFFMLPCLIDKGFDPSGENTRNRWNVFHYVAFDQDEDRTGKILEFLMMKCDMNWFDDLDSLVDSPIQALDAITNDNTQKVKQLNKQEHAWLAMFVILSKQEYTKLLSGQEVQEAIEIMQAITQGNVRTVIIRDVRDDVPQFTHRIFAEYFAASWIYNNKHLLSSESFFRSWEYWISRMHRTRDFLNRMIVRDCERSDIFMAVINQSEHKVRELIFKDPSIAFVKDGIGRLPLHIAVLYPSQNITKVLIEKLDFQSINCRDEQMKWTALDYAFAILNMTTVKHMLTVGAVANMNNLLQQISSNKLSNLLVSTNYYGKWLISHEHSMMVAYRLHIRIVEYLLKERHLDVFSRQEELDYLTVLEFCSKHDMFVMFKQFVSQSNIRDALSTDACDQLFKIASTNKSHDIVAYFVDIHNRLLPQLKSAFELISALKSCIKHNHMNLFKDLFQRLLNFQLNIHLDDDTDIVIDDHATGNCNLSPLDKGHYPKSCCVRSFENVRISLPEYDEKDILHEGYLVEALLAEAVHEGNLQIVKYIVQKTNMAVTNRLIVMVMRLLPKGEEVCHEKSMSAFTYLLERTTDLDSVDEDGRNLLHMTAQNGCFFMLPCLIDKGFDPRGENTKNGWNVFHYVAFDQDEDRTGRILEFLMMKCDMNWFDDLDSLVDSPIQALDAITNYNTQKVKQLNKQEHAWLAMFVILSNQEYTKLLSGQEVQKAIEIMQAITQGKVRTVIIRDVRDDVPQFTHRIFAEYFAAYWIYNNKHLMRSESFFRSWEYWISRMHRTRDFLNRMIVRDCERSDIFMAVINQSEQKVRELIFKDPSIAFVKDGIGRLPLHIAVLYPSQLITNVIIEKMDFQSINCRDEQMKWTALEYAFAMFHVTTVKHLLTNKAIVKQDVLLQQIFSNHMGISIYVAHYYGKWLNAHDDSTIIAGRLYFFEVQYLLKERHLDVFSRHKELDSLTVLEFCSKHNMIGMFKEFVSQTNIRDNLSTDACTQLLKIASTNKAFDIVAYFVDIHNRLLPQMKSVVELISALKSCIKQNHMNLFKDLFQRLLNFQLNIHLDDDTDIVIDDHATGNCNLSPLDKGHYPKSCCVRSFENVRISLPEYDEKDILHEGYLVEALLAEAVHEGNLQIVKYIVQKTNMAVTNRLIVMVMRLLPKGEEVCHEKSMSAFTYLLERTTDLDSVDEDGRNLLHMTAQNGCFFMLCCLIDKGFDPRGENTRIGWNVFHYVAFDQDEDRTGKILEFLMMKCDMNWFDDLDSLVDSLIQALDAITNDNTQKVKQLNKQEHAWLAMFVILSNQGYTKLLSGQEVQEAIEIMQAITQGNVRTVIIRDVRDDVPQFTHRIFAEYFAAYWIYNNKHLLSSESFFRSWEYWIGRMHRTRDFLNRMIVRDSVRSDIFMAVINQSEHKVRELIFKDPSVAFVKDAAGRLPLHIAMMYPSQNIKKLLVEKMPVHSINTNDDLFQWTALDYAFAIRYKNSVKTLLTYGAVVNEDNLLQLMLSNKLRTLLVSAYYYGKWLLCHEHSMMVVDRLHIRIVEYLLKERHLDVFSRHKELDSLTVLEFCSKHDMVGMFKQFVSQSNIRDALSTDACDQLFKIASTNKAFAIVAYFVDIHNRLLPQMKSVVELISALKSCIKHNHMNLFKDLFQRLLNFQLNIHLDDDTDIVIDDHATGNCNLSPLDKGHYPKSCCVRSFENVRISLPEYDEKDILHEGYLVEALLAEAVHEGNLQIVKYIVQKTNMAITNRLIVMVMRLLPKGEEVCHEKSMSAFTYLLERTTDLDSVDEDGRNLLHMTAQNGCFFMLPCLIDKGFDPRGENTKNRWNVFHYVAFDQDEDRTGKILEFLMMKCDMNWFDDLDSLVDSPIQALDAITNDNTQKVKQLNKQEHAWLAMFVILSKQEYTKLLSGQEVQEAIEIMQAITQGNVRTVIIRDVRDDVPQFTHRIFAEYFAASWIYNNKHLLSSESFFRSWEYWISRMHRTRDFLNRMIVRDCERSDIFMAVINQSEHKVRELMCKDPSAAFVKDDVGRLPLHIAVLYESLEIRKMLVEKMSLDSINTKDELFQWTALDYAFAIRYTTAVKKLLTAGATVNVEVLFQQSESSNLNILLSRAHDCGIQLNSHRDCEIVANRLHVRVVEYLLEEIHLDVLSRHGELDSLTVLEFCSKRNMIGIFETLVNTKNVRTKFSTDMFHRFLELAIENEAHEVVAFLKDNSLNG